VRAEDSDDEEEGRRRAGGNRHDENDEEIIKIIGAPRLSPPETAASTTNLRPIPEKEIESEEWDQPGRQVSEPKDQDEMSAGEVEHYEPDGGVYFPERERKNPLEWKKDWNRPKPEEPDEIDPRKHRIQAGLGEQEVWNKLDEESQHKKATNQQGDGFDWVIQSALGALDQNGNSDEEIL
jgi:hypothetical protein